MKTEMFDDEMSLLCLQGLSAGKLCNSGVSFYRKKRRQSFNTSFRSVNCLDHDCFSFPISSVAFVPCLVNALSGRLRRV